MTDPPPGWAMTTLGEIATSVRNGIFVSRPGTQPNGVPILRISAVRPGRLNVGDFRYSGQTAEALADSDSLLAVEDLLFTRYNGNIDLVGACAAVPSGVGALTYPDKLIRVRVDTNVAIPRYVTYAFTSPRLRSQVRALARTTAGQVGVSGTSLQSIELPLPPLAEQGRIVAALEDHLSRIDAAASGVQRAVQRTAMFRESLLHRAVTGRLARQRSREPADWLNRIEVRRSELVRTHQEAAKPVAIPGYDLPTGWSVASLDAISYASGYGTSAKCDYNAAGPAVVRIPNVQGGEVLLDDLKFAIDPTLELSSLYLHRGDLLFVRTNGSRDLIGRMAVVRKDMDVAFASYLIRFRLVPEGIPADWVRIVVNSPLWRQYLEGQAASSAGQYNLSTRVLAPLAIPIPPPEEMTDIQDSVERFQTVAEVCRRTSQASLGRSAALRRALLSEAFSGRLAPQDPGEEPASVLLERIRREREAEPKPQRRRRTASVSQKETLL